MSFAGQFIQHTNLTCCQCEPCCPVLVAGLKGICSFVFEREDDFPEILEFTNDMSRQYGLNVHKLHADFRSGVEGLLETTKLKAIILGTRRYILCGVIALQLEGHALLSIFWVA